MLQTTLERVGKERIVHNSVDWSGKHVRYFLHEVILLVIGHKL